MKKEHFQRRLGSLRIIPFIGFGNNKTAFISGEVVAAYGLSKPVDGQTKWQNVKAMAKRYLSNEIEYIDVTITFMGMSQTVTTDKYGIFRSTFNLDQNIPIRNNWQKTYISFPKVQDSSVPPLQGQFEGEVMLVNDNPQFGIISDIDDTILVSYATQKLQKLMLMILNNARTRMPFEGISAFYQALQKGHDNKSFNPVFYVSNSEWNLYDLLYEFIEFHRIPKGPLILREMAFTLWRPWKLREVNKNHKKDAIRKLLSVYNTMKFILIGDSGQKDPEIYSEIVREFPGRVPAIYIRDIGNKQNLTKINLILEELQSKFSTEMILVKDSYAAAMHAAGKGFISTECLKQFQNYSDSNQKLYE